MQQTSKYYDPGPSRIIPLLLLITALITNVDAVSCESGWSDNGFNDCVICKRIVVNF